VPARDREARCGAIRLIVSAFFAFLHHVAAFTLVAALTVEFVLIRENLTVRNARKIQFADLVFGIAAGAVLVVGLLRVSYFEKGASYYFHSVPFIAKLLLFVLIALLSIYPTVQLLSWGKSMRQGRQPIVADHKLRLIRSLIHWELAAVVVLILCAALMARGIGFRG
jgi:putative membrane protein